MKLADMYVDISTKMGGLTSGLAKAESMVKGAALRMGTMLAAGIGGVTITGGIIKAVTAASDLNEALSFSGVVFGESAGVITAEADKMAATFGTVKKEFIEASTTLGSGFKNAGKTREEAARLGVQMGKLGMELAAAKNTADSEAFTALAAAFRGEYDPLERFAVEINATTVGQEALRMGLVKSAGAMDLQAKKMATVSLLMKQTKDAQGTLARESTSYAAQSKKLWGTLENSVTSFGMALLPTFTRLITNMSASASALGAWVDRNQAAVANFAVEIVADLEGIGKGFVSMAEVSMSSIQTIVGGLGQLLASLSGYESAQDGFMANASYAFRHWTELYQIGLLNLTEAFFMAYRELQSVFGLFERLPVPSKFAEDREKLRIKMATEEQAHLARLTPAGAAGAPAGPGKPEAALDAAVAKAGKGKGEVMDTLAFARRMTSGGDAASRDVKKVNLLEKVAAATEKTAAAVAGKKAAPTVAMIPF